MTPEERANKVREMLHPEGDLILPPGSIILIPDEVLEVREALRCAALGDTSMCGIGLALLGGGS